MSKLARMKKQAEVAKEERLTQAKQKIEEAGMGFVDHELPPDEVSEREVRRSILTSIRTFIPYTNEWYEARAAEEEMDDLRKIRIEKVKAADLYTRTKIGQHDEALDEMMAETNNDFFFFNKLKYKMENEGKWHFEFKQNSVAFANGNKAAVRNRLRKAINTVYGELDASVTDELARLANAEAAHTKRYDRSAPCNWRGRNKDNEALKCENMRVERPPRSDAPPRKKNDPPDILACCAYHTPFCICDVHELRADVKIKVPNDEAMCAECYMMKRGKKPPPFTATIVPGVVLSSMAKPPPVEASPKKSRPSDDDYDDSKSVGGESVASQASRARRKVNANKCTWVPNPDNVKARGYECCNEKFLHPVNQLKLTTCAWHTTVCLRDHPPGVSPTITIPNPYGLCAQHYLAEKGEPVRPHPFPLPGMQIKLARDHWKGKRHFAVPKERPPEVIHAKEYEEPEEPQNWMQSLGRIATQQAYKRRVRKQGKEMATRIQSWFRGCRSRYIHVNIKFLRAKYKRLVSVVRIQSLARRRFAVNRVRAKRLRANNAARDIQRTWRGMWCRKLLRIDWAARRITKFFKLTFFFKFKDAVIMIMQIRRLFKRRMMLVIRIQRLFRGFSARWFVYRKRLWNIVSRSCVQKIQRAWRQLLKRRAYVPWYPPGEDWVLRNCAKKLSRMLLEMYLDRHRRAQLAQLMHHSAPDIQRLVRGFLARAGNKKMAFLRNAMRQWINPRLAGEFMEKYLNSRMYFSVQLSTPEVALEERVDNPFIIRKFLSEDKRKRFEIDFRTFEPAIEAYYKSQNMILLQSERNSILRKFRNPMNGKVQIKPLDQFISAHKLPCRRHGRFICGDCVFRKNCQIGSCKCTLFKSSTSDGHGICITCDHPGSLHSLCPKQMRYSNRASKNASLLSILTTIREPDMSFPTGVTGVAAEGIIVPAETADDRRVAHTKMLLEERRTQRLVELGLTAAGRSLTKSLALCETCGDSVHANTDYWNVHALSALAPIENTTDKSDTAIFDPVMHDNHPPNYNVTSAAFWNLTAKNPNKTVRDYHEKFDHNMPVPVVKNDEIVYSFEGPQIYFNLVNQIIRMDEKVNFDDPEFLKLVVDHIQLFERHWRKMVADIRTGKLDRRLQINPESRLIFENANIPKPNLAKRLDDTFRKLGFHMKVLGKDINIQPYAKKKKVGIYAEVQPRRKRSLPTNALTSALRPFSSDDLTRKAPGEWDQDIAGFAKQQQKTRFLIEEKEPTQQPIQPPISPVRLQRLNSMTSPSKLQRLNSSTSPGKLQRLGSSLSPGKGSDGEMKGPGGRSAPTRRSLLFSMGTSTKTLTSLSGANADDNSSGGFRGASPPLKRAATKRELLSALGQSFRMGSPEPSDSRPDTGKSLAASRPVTANFPAKPSSRPATRDDLSTPQLKRRGSFSDAEAKSITAHELNAAHYAVETAARDNYRLAIKADGDRFVCPFPACGKSFHSKDAAFRHLPEHEQRTRLYAPTPLPDSHLNVYWPSNVPWLTDERYAKRAIPPGSIVCKVAGCKEVFPDRVHLDLHMRHKHKIVGSSSQTHGYFKLNGNAVYCPPDEPPTYAPIKWCSHHSLPLGSCTTCVEIDAGKGPKQPFRFYDGVTINFRLKRSLKLGLPTFMNADAETGVVSFSASESTIGVVVTSRARGSSSEDLLAEDSPKLGRAGTLRRLNSVGSIGSSKNLRRRGSVSSMTGSSKQLALDLNTNSNSTAVHEWRGRPVAIVVDRNENGWVAVEMLLTHQEALQQGLFVPRDFDKRHQLLRPLRAYVRLDAHKHLKLTELDAYDGEAEALFEKYIRWVPIHMIDRTFSLKLVLTQEEVTHTINTTSHTGLRNKFFVEHSDVESSLL